MRCIISGATGTIGTALIYKCIEKHIEVLVITRKNSARNSKIPHHPLVKKCFCELEDLKKLQNNTGKKYDVFYHFAWMGTTGLSRDDMYMQNLNVKYALDAVAVARRFGCNTFIGAGSQAEYGRVGVLLTPDTPTFPETGYGMAKLCAGQMTREYAHQLGMRHIWVRILSVYGPNDGEQSMIMSTIKMLQEGKTPKFTKGEQLWDYLYSGDAANAFLLLGQKEIDGKTYVLGSGQAKPLIEYIEEIRNIINPEGKIDVGIIPYSKKQVMYLQADISDLQDDIGWNPIVDFDEGIKKIIQEQRKENG